MSFNESKFQHRVRNLFLLPRKNPLPPPSVTLITFEGLQTFEQVGEYYNGGFGSMGSGPGPAYGVSFSFQALALQETYPDAAFTNEPSYQTIGFVYDDLWPNPGVRMSFVLNKPDGFIIGFSFYYCSYQDIGGLPNAVCEVWSEVDATGTLLGWVEMPVTPPIPPLDPNVPYNNWVQVGFPFAGTGKSARFFLYNNQTGLDDIRFGEAP